MPAFAGRPLTTEDASVLPDKACQVEAWVDRGRTATNTWVVPACNFGANIEWQAGGVRTHAEGQTITSEMYAQAKTVFRGAPDAPLKAGLILGVTRRPIEPEHNGWHNPYAIVPLTYTQRDSTNTFHTALGVRHDRSSGRNVTLWGIAAERAIGERFTALGEVFGENARNPFYRIGGRYTAIRDHLDIDLTIVARPGGTREERFVSLGVTWQSGRFLP
jgi:hypothetical protein